jgi:hypothetical protein
MQMQHLPRSALLHWVLLLAVATTGSVATAAHSRFGIGVYTDTPGSPKFEQQLDAALELVGAGGWVTLFLCSWRTHTTSCLNKTTTHDPLSSAMLQAAYRRKLNVVARIGNPYAPRDHADDTASHSSFTELAAAYGRLVSSLPPPPDGVAPLYVQVGNELNACNEWQCTSPPSVNMSSAQMASEVAAFVRDVAAALAPLRNGSRTPWPRGRLRVAHAPISNWDRSPCQCTTTKPLGGGSSGLTFLQAMLGAVPDLYSATSVDWLSSHAYPYSGEPFGSGRATRGLTYYRNETELVGRGDKMPVIITETGWRRHSVSSLSESSRRDPPKPSPTSATQQANWTVLAYKELWLRDPQVLAACPFLLAGEFWEAGGWPWMRGAGLTPEPVYTAVKQLRHTAATRTILKTDDDMPASVATTFPGLGVSFYIGPGVWHNLSFVESDFTVTRPGSWTIATASLHATITERVGGFFELTFTSLQHDVPRVSFPNLHGTSMDAAPGMVALFPFLGGIFIQAGASCYGECMSDAVMAYPGGFHAPYVMLATPDRALMAAATTWPPHHVHPKRRMEKGVVTGAQPLLIDWVDGYKRLQPTTLTILLREFTTDHSSGTAAWQASILAYRRWLSPNLTPPPPPEPTVGGEGCWALALENKPSFNLTQINAEFRQWQSVFGRVAVWGQMSNYCGPPRLAHPPLRLGEKTGCCVLNQSMHPRYLTDCGDLSSGAPPPPWKPGSQCLPAWAQKLAGEGTHIGFYVRKGSKGDLANNLTFFVDWLNNMAKLGGNAQYVDTFARTYNGRPTDVLRMIHGGIPKADVITEGWNDLYPFAGLLSGYHRGFDWASCCSPTSNESYSGQCCNTTIYDMTPFGMRTNGSFIKMVRLLMGSKVGYFGYEDSELRRYGWQHSHFSERQAFLMGAKAEGGRANDFLSLVQKLLSRLHWWQRDMVYMDTIGIVHTHEGVLDVRRHDDAQNRTILLVDNFQNRTGLQVSFAGKVYKVSGHMISAISVQY